MLSTLWCQAEQRQVALSWPWKRLHTGSKHYVMLNS